MKSSDRPEDTEFVRALARGLAVIECFEGGRRLISLTEVARRTGLARGSARRLLLTLEKLGYVGHEDGLFCLMARTLRLGHAFLTSSPISLAAEATLRQLSEKLDQSCSLAEMDGSEIVYINRVSPRRLIRDYIEIGRRMPAYPTSMGRVLLAEYDDQALDAYLARADIAQITPRTTTDTAELGRLIREARLRGYAISSEEIEIGRCSVAVPVRSRDGRAVAAVNVSAASATASCDELVERYLSSLREASSHLAHVLAFTGDRLR